MSKKKLTQEYFDQLKSGIHACPINMSLVVGKEYMFDNPSDKSETIKARCTQDRPYALLRIDL